jgi:hypothetical protein
MSVSSISYRHILIFLGLFKIVFQIKPMSPKQSFFNVSRLQLCIFDILLMLQAIPIPL